MATTTTTLSPPFALLYVRPEIASGFYHVADVGPAAPDDPTSSFPHLPGVPADQAASLFANGQIVQAITQRIQQSGLVLSSQRTVHFSKPQLRRLRFCGTSSGDDDDHQARAAFLGRFTRGPTLVLLLTLPQSTTDSNPDLDPDAAIVALRSLVGPEDPELARKQAISAGLSADKWGLRALCGVNRDFPGLHLSATFDCAVRERHELFPPRCAPLESAVVALFPAFIAAIPDGVATIRSQFNKLGVIVTTTVEIPSLSTDQITAITIAELPASTNDGDREIFRHQLSLGTTSTSSSTGVLVLRVVGLHLRPVLLRVFGPASVAAAHQFFPDSLRAQLPVPLLGEEQQEEDDTTRAAAACLASSVFISHHPLAIQQLAPEDERIQSTFAIIKPNAACHPDTVAQIQQTICTFGFEITRQSTCLRLTRAQAASFYAEHTGKPFFERLLRFMTSGEIVAMQLTRKLAVPLWRALMGPTDCAVARATAPWTLRAQFGVDGTQNATHGSDALASARRELRFFFGASAQNAPLVSDVEIGDDVARVVAHMPLVPPYRRSDTFEKVLVNGLDEMLQFYQQQQLQPMDCGPLAACRWLGEWLLRQSEQSQNQSDGSGGEAPQPKTRSSTARRTVPSAVVDSPLSLSLGDSHSILAITVDASVPPATTPLIRECVRVRAMSRGYAFEDASGVASDLASIDVLFQRVRDAGRSRVVLFGWPSHSSGSSSHGISTRVTIAMEDAIASSDSPPDPLVPHTYVALPGSVSTVLELENSAATAAIMETALRPLFHRVLDPVVVLVEENSETATCHGWQQVASRGGFAFVAFDALVASEITRENDFHGPFTQWKRTNNLTTTPSSPLPPTDLLLSAIRKVIHDPARMVLDGATHKFLLYGFPWTAMGISASALGSSVGRVHCVLQVRRGCGDGSGSHETPPSRGWRRELLRRGAVHVVRSSSDPLVARVLMPRVTFVVGKGDASTAGLVARVARQQGATFIEIASLPPTCLATADALVGTLNQLLLRTSRGLSDVVLQGFPRSREDVELFLQRVVAPCAVLMASSATEKSSLYKELLAFLQQQAPHAIQSVVPSSDPLLRGLLHHKSVAFAVAGGNPNGISAVNTRQLRLALTLFGCSVIDLSGDGGEDNDATTASSSWSGATRTLDAIASCASPRVLVLGGSTQVDYFRSLHASLGSALLHVFILKQRKPRPLPKPRTDADDDGYDSEEEAERERQRQREATTLSPPLTQLVQLFTNSTTSSGVSSSTGNPSVDVVSFLHPQEAHDHLTCALRPRVVAVVGHRHSFYRDAARRVCRHQQLPFLELSVGSSSSTSSSKRRGFAEQLTMFHAIVSASSAPTLVVDGFPRAVVNPGEMEEEEKERGGDSVIVAPYAIQQLWMLEEQGVVTLPLLVQFRTSLDVLMDKKPTNISRNALEDAQDALEDATRDLVAYFTRHGKGGGRGGGGVAASGRRRLRDVSCERELQDAQDEFTDVLTNYKLV